MAGMSLKCKNLNSKGTPNGVIQHKKEPTIDYDYFANAKAKRRTPSALREIEYDEFTIPLASGSPNPSTFPFKKLTVDLKDGAGYTVKGTNLETAFQYLPTPGYPGLVKQLKKIQERVHGVRNWGDDGQNLMVCSGAQEAISAVFDIVVVEGDPVIIPIPLYPGAADLLRALKPKYIALHEDKEGIVPQDLRQALEKLVEQKKTLPKVMYINPTGSNPTGANLSTDRKRELYKIACEYNFLILEDDPYYFLNYSEEVITSFLSMDVEGRVLRLDTFSKILGAGLRLGYVTGPSPLLRRIEAHIQLSTLHACSMSQVLVSMLLDHWSFEKFIEHNIKVNAFYKERRDLMLAACDKYLEGLAEWDVPLGGMFVWLKVIVLRDTWTLAMKNCMEKSLLILSGHPFTGELVPKHHNYIRLSFSLATPQQIDEGVKILSEAIREEVNKSNKLTV